MEISSSSEEEMEEKTLVCRSSRIDVFALYVNGFTKGHVLIFIIVAFCYLARQTIDTCKISITSAQRGHVTLRKVQKKVSRPIVVMHFVLDVLTHACP